ARASSRSRSRSNRRFSRRMRKTAEGCKLNRNNSSSSSSSNKDTTSSSRSYSKNSNRNAKSNRNVRKTSHPASRRKTTSLPTAARHRLRPSAASGGRSLRNERSFHLSRVLRFLQVKRLRGSFDFSRGRGAPPSVFEARPFADESFGRVA